MRPVAGVFDHLGGRYVQCEAPADAKSSSGRTWPGYDGDTVKLFVDGAIVGSTRSPPRNKSD